MNLIQFSDSEHNRRVGIVTDTNSITPLAGTQTVRELALYAIAAGIGLKEQVRRMPTESPTNYTEILRTGRVLPPLDHPDPAHTLVTGTGLTHLGSAQARNAMHATLAADESSLTDSMKIFR